MTQNSIPFTPLDPGYLWSARLDPGIREVRKDSFVPDCGSVSGPTGLRV